ncbi:MAG: CDC48 family AAA ATPase [Candidatus Aenigmarchaeota archaeon]|nr:CDC48 family AAA ATPase [Candidatus Aenigmarchaeota archaeon]MDW8149164.1 CDC48 family AAA ATPase [Candidatus Aenigmarchaeota archaeon]
MSDKEEIKLKVGELSSRDEFGLGIVRVDSSILQKLGIREGDPIEIEDKRKTVAIAYRSYPADKGLNIIRMDGITRKNCGSAIGEYVKVRKPEVKEARRVVIAPATRGTPIISSSYARRALIGRPVFKGDLISLRRRRGYYSEFFFPFDIEELEFFIPSSENRFVVTNTDPSGFVIITENTEIEVLKEVPEMLREGKVPTVTYEDIGGIKPIIEKVREMIELPLRLPELFDRLGIDAPKGILLYGPPGTGKTLLAKAVANESGANFISVSGPEFLSKFYGESEANLRRIFEEAEKNAPSIIFFDEIDAIAPKREEVTGEVERRIVSQLLSLMDGLKSRGKVVVIAATNRPNAIDPALRRPGRFDREIEFPVPDTNGRYEILVIHTRNMPINPFEKSVVIEELINLKKEDIVKKINKIDDENEIREIIYKELDKETANNLEKTLREKLLRKLAEITHGYVGADLAALAREAAMSALRRVLPQIKWKEEEKLSEEELSKIFVTWKDFENALKMVEPSAMREVLVEVPKVRWSDIGGLEEVKRTLREMIEWPLKYRESFGRMGIEPPKGILLYGPPGTGKTLLAKAVANESGANFIAVKGPELTSMWFGEPERKIRELFRRARQVAPAIIFFDEIDALAPRRGYLVHEATERIVSQLLTEMSGITDIKNVVIMAATNRPDLVDPALLRPGRLDKLIFIPPPDKDARLEILKIHTRNMPLAKDVDLKEIAEKTENYSGADLEALVKEAALNALREDMNAKEVRKIHFEEALKKVLPSLSKEMIEYYKRFETRRRAVEEKEREENRYIA